MQHPYTNSCLRSSSLQCDCIPGRSILVCSSVLILSFSISDISFPSHSYVSPDSSQPLLRRVNQAPLGEFCPCRSRSDKHELTLYPCRDRGCIRLAAHSTSGCLVLALCNSPAFPGIQEPKLPDTGNPLGYCPKQLSTT